MHLTRLEDGDVELAVLAQHPHLEVRLHVVGSNSVLMDDGAGYPLANLLLAAVLHGVAGDVVETLPSARVLS